MGMKMGVIRILFILVTIGCASARPSKADTCGYEVLQQNILVLRVCEIHC